MTPAQFNLRFLASCLAAGAVGEAVLSIDPHDVRALIGAFSTYAVILVVLCNVAGLFSLCSGRRTTAQALTSTLPC